MTLTILFLAFLTLVLSKKETTRWHQLEGYSFEKYCDEFGLSYSPTETKLRKSLFEKRLTSIKIHNSDKTKTWKQGVNKFTDRTDSEIEGFYRGTSPHSNLKEYRVSEKAMIPVEQLPKEKDWRKEGIISNVKDQGRCGSCWSFASAENVESYYALQHGNLPVLSEQQILDCTPNPNECGGTGGCGGATVELAYAQIMAQGGLSSEWTYPYTSYFGVNFQCDHTKIVPVARLSGYINLESNKNEPILNHLATTGPLAITIDASAWSSYESGVFDGCNQTNPDLDHGVQLVGYGTDIALGDYWLVRNSWSPNWGESGYIRIRRTKVPRCGLDLTPLDGDACKNETQPIIVCGTCGILYDTLYPLIK